MSDIADNRQQAPFTHRYINVGITIPGQGQGEETTLTYEGILSGQTFHGQNFHLPSVERSGNDGPETGTTGAAGTTLPFRNYRIACSIAILGGKVHPQCSLSIYNMGKEKMARLSQFGNTGLFRYTSNGKAIAVSVYAGENPEKISRIFEGSLLQCHADFSSAPDPFLFLQASTLSDFQLKPRIATSYEGDIEASAILGQIARENGLLFENSGVKTVLHNPYFSGSTREQIAKCASVGRFNYVIENGLLAIWPLGGSRKRFDAGEGRSLENTGASNAGTSRVPSSSWEKAVVITPQNGLVGYPSFNGSMVSLRCLFRNDIRNGDMIKVESSFFGVSGYYIVSALAHSLSTETVSGPWFTDIQAITVQGVDTEA